MKILPSSAFRLNPNSSFLQSATPNSFKTVDNNLDWWICWSHFWFQFLLCWSKFWPIDLFDVLVLINRTFDHFFFSNFSYVHLIIHLNIYLYEYERQGPAPRAFFGQNCNWLINFYCQPFVQGLSWISRPKKAYENLYFHPAPRSYQPTPFSVILVNLSQNNF